MSPQKHLEKEKPQGPPPGESCSKQIEHVSSLELGLFGRVSSKALSSSWLGKRGFFSSQHVVRPSSTVEAGGCWLRTER